MRVVVVYNVLSYFLRVLQFYAEPCSVYICIDLVVYLLLAIITCNSVFFRARSPQMPISCGVA